MGENTLKNLEIENLVYLIRGDKVMLDAALATIYGVETKRLNEQVKRNMEWYSADFMFQLTKEEWESLKSQNAATKEKEG